MMKDFRFSRRSSISNGNNNENIPINPSETLNSVADPDPRRPPFNPIQDSIPVSRRKPAESTSTPCKNPPLRTPEKSSACRNRFGWAPAAENSDDSSQNIPFQFPPLNRYGNGAGTVTPRTHKVVSGKASSSVHSESNSTHSTPSKSVVKPSYGVSAPRPPVSAGVRVGLVRGLPICASPVRVVDTPDVAHFELKEDPSFWLDHNVQVVIRVRPLNSNERSLCGFNRCLKQESSQTITWIGQPESRFMFDYVACETINQEMLFRVTGLPMVENCMSGYNSCMFAYGQTGSGKTYTMLGEISNLDVRPSAGRGMTPRIFEFLFARIRAEEESRRDEKLKYNCKCSFLEIYNEQITDLLDPSSTNLLLREDVEKGVYVENLTEFKVESVNDVLTLIVQGSANRRVAATNMNRESSRSHSVFTCVIESRWEKDSTTNFRFARLNLVDLAGSERQKTSGAEGERLKEAASINKSLSTLGHVIMVLSDLANGKQKHVPYRDSRLTFLLQDSLGGNSKTMIIANISPSMCSASETLSTLKFAQRARLIQNNAVVNEDTSGDVLALQRQIRLLKEEVAQLKSQNAQRSMLLHMDDYNDSDENCVEKSEDMMGHIYNDKRLSNGSSKSIKLSNKQWKSLEATLAGALRRERAAEVTIKQLEAEIEQLNRLVRQREDDTRCTKMMLKFREDKINRMEAIVRGEITSDLYLTEENRDLTKEIELLRARVDRNPEVTRFALENIRLLDQIRRYQDFYDEGERNLLINEVSQLRNQLMHLLDGKPELEQLALATENQELEDPRAAHLNANSGSFSTELKRTSEELERCRNDLQACLDVNENLRREIADLKTKLSSTKYGYGDESKEEILNTPENIEDQVLNIQLELDIHRTILEEEKSAHIQTSEKTIELKTELSNANSIIESLESQIILLIKELEEVKERNNFYKKIEPRRLSLKEKEDSPLNKKLKKMQASIEMARSLKHLPESPRERERDEVRKQAEVATAEVIVCLQEELEASEERVEELENERIELRAQLDALEREKEETQREWEMLAHEIANVLVDGNAALESASDEFITISGGNWQKNWVGSQVKNLTKGICERDGLIEELNNCLADAQMVSNDLEWKLRSLRGATLAITEAHQQENVEREREIGNLEDEICLACLEQEVILGYFATMQLETIEESKETIQEADDAMNALMHANEGLKHQIENYERSEMLLTSQVQSLASSLDVKEREFKLVSDSLTELEMGFKYVQSLASHHMETVSSDLNNVKLGFKKDVSKVRELLEGTWLEIIRKDCALSVLSLCQMGIMWERINASDSLIYTLRENNLKAETELKLCSVLKGKLLSDITNGFNRISEKEEETKELKLRVNCFEAKIQELQLQEERMFERSDDMHEEVKRLVKEIECNKQHKLSRERELIFGVIEELGEEAALRSVDWQLSLVENEILRDELREVKEEKEGVLQQMSELESKNDVIFTVFEETMMHATLDMVELQLSLLENIILGDELQESKKAHEALVHENINLQDAVCSSDLFMKTLNHDLNSKIGIVGERLERNSRSVDRNIDLVSSKVDKDMVENMNMVSVFACEVETLEKKMLEELKAAKDDKEEEIEEMSIALETLKTELEERNIEIEDLVSGIEERDNAVKSLEREISELKSMNGRVKDLEAKLSEQNWVVVKLEEELITSREMVHRKSCCIEELRSRITRLTGELEMANALAEENEAVAIETRQIAEERKVHAEEKEEEVKLLENSIQELEATVYALENKVDMIKEEASKQQRERELLEAELHQVRKQLEDTCGGDVQTQILELKNNIEMLEKELSNKEAEIDQCKGHISELNMHAEAQAREYKQKFRELEALASHLKSTESTASANSSCSMNNNNNHQTTKVKGTGSPFKGRGSGSPFKCIGLGMIQQINSEKDEDITALKCQIEELENLAASRQKEIFMLNTRLAAAESMTHDVIRDLLGVKMDMASYATMLDKNQKISPRAMDFVNEQEQQEKEHDIKELKKKLNELIEERQGWIDEINQRQTEILAARVAAEKLRQREQMLLTENEMLKCENENYKNKVVQLEDEMHRLPVQHNLHMRIHHHARTKEENNALRKQNDDLRAKLERTESTLEHVKEELARYRASNGKSPYYDLEEEERLRQSLKQCEERRLGLLQEFMDMCTRVFEVAGYTDKNADKSPQAAKAALHCISDRIASLEDEVHDLKLKCKLQSEREKLAELRWNSSPLRRTNSKERCNSPCTTSDSTSVSLL